MDKGGCQENGVIHPHCSLGTGAMDALEPLRQRYNQQHYALLKFYYECSNLKYLTSLINVPKLPADPPSLIEASTPKLPKRPQVAESTPPPAQPSPEPVIDFWSQQQAQQQREYEEEQRRLAQQRAEEQERMRQLQLQQQREFEEQQRLLAERERQQQEELLRQQMQNHQAGRINELEMQLLQQRNQIERDQMLLEQYDRVSCKEDANTDTKLRSYLPTVSIESESIGTRTQSSECTCPTKRCVKR